MNPEFTAFIYHQVKPVYSGLHSFTHEIMKLDQFIMQTTLFNADGQVLGMLKEIKIFATSSDDRPNLEVIRVNTIL